MNTYLLDTHTHTHNSRTELEVDKITYMPLSREGVSEALKCFLEPIQSRCLQVCLPWVWATSNKAHAVSILLCDLPISGS